MAPILFDIQDGVGSIILNRPEAYNSVTRDLALGFQEHLATCAAEPSIRAVFLTGNGKAFCAGQDLKEATSADKNFGFERVLREHYNPIILGIRQLEKPVVCAVNGIAAGAGANIALACDVVVAADTASFLQAFSNIGLIPDSGGTYTLPRLIGFQKALALSLLAEKVSAEEAERMGMIYKVFPAESFAENAWKLAAKLAKMPTKGLGCIKQAFNQSLTNSLEEQLEVEKKFQTIAGATADYQEGVQAFLEKRKPKFEGK